MKVVRGIDSELRELKQSEENTEEEDAEWNNYLRRRVGREVDEETQRGGRRLRVE